ncbi:RidA family protein [Rhizobium sp. GN54]|uniref:RidA family protein n=1 Tax=Rhizobium sp. GN54 TaxID=2898150 RepID=UPI001E41251C|nr:RidA family protein [Rhizobium sp. GN54]MCD2184768.1 RidA family protein [Rhizobium sp. GN54]
MTIIRHHSSNRMSQVVEFPLSGTMVVLAGQVSSDRDLDVAGQTANILARVDALLAEAGTGKAAITHAYIWLKHGTDFDAMNSVWDVWVAPDAAPARACVEAPLADPRLLVEIQVFALKP